MPMDPQFAHALFEERRALHCPTCGRYAKVDPHRLTAGIALGILDLYKHYGTEPFDLPAHYHPNKYTVTTAKNWRLIRRRDDLHKYRVRNLRRTEYRESQILWQITEEGEQFARCELRVPLIAMLYDDEVHWYTGPKITIVEALKSHPYEPGEWSY